MIDETRACPGAQAPAPLTLLNRERAILQFNRRVLAQAAAPMCRCWSGCAT
jgi:hypothetical protein